MTTFEVTRDGTTVEDAVYDVDPVSVTANPFGTFAVAKIDDRGGEKFSGYARGTRIDVSITEDATTIDKFTGYVVERRETEQGGADALEVEAYSFDQFLRRNSVTNDQTGNTIVEALADIIATDTPVSYVAGNIDVGDDQELTRSYQGEKVENVLRDLAFKSNNEEFGVNDSLEFFFRPRESTHIDRGIDNSQWFNYDIPELGKQAINEVEVWFNGGDESVIVDDGTDKLDLQDNLGLPEPGTQRAELQREELTDIGDAEDEGRKYLEFRNATLSGTVTTYGLYDAQPGDTIDIEITPRGIDEEFVIAGIEYRWGRDETILTIIEKRGDVDGILSELNDSVKRQEMDGADRDAPSNRITTTNATGLVRVDVAVADSDSGVVSGEFDKTVFSTSTPNFGDVAASITSQQSDFTSVEVEVLNEGSIVASDGNTGSGGISASVSVTDVEYDEIRVSESEGDGADWEYSISKSPTNVKFVNDGRRAVRDGWADKGNVAISNVVVGDDGTGLSRSNTSLVNQTNSAAVSESLPDSKSVEYSATVTQTNVAEVGLTDSSGTLIARAVFGTPIDLDGTVSVTLAVSNDDSVSRGVLTNDGQTAVRDVLADNSPAVPDNYAYGSDGAAVAESDTALGNELVTTSLTNILLGRTDTTAEWTNRTPDATDSDVWKVENGELTTKQVAWTREAENPDASDSGATTGPDDPGEFSNGDWIPFATSDHFAEYDFTVEHDVSDLRAQVRYATDTDGQGSAAFDAVLLDDSGSELDRIQVVGDGSTLSSPFWGSFNEVVAGAVGPGEYTLRLECTTTSTALDDGVSFIDVVAPYDAAFAGDLTFDDTVDGNGALSGPERYPELVELGLTTFSTRRDVTEANFTSTWDDTTNSQYVELANDGSTFTRFNNASSGSVTFAGADRGVDVNLGLSRYASDPTSTPAEGDSGQAVDLFELFGNPDAVLSDDIGTTITRGVVPPNTSGVVGETVREAGLKSGSVLLTRHELAEFTVLADQRLASAESTTFTGGN